MILIDTSIWVAYFQGKSTPLEEVLGTGAERLHPWVYGELLLNGLPRKGTYAQDLLKLKPAPVASISEVAAFIGWAKLAGTGVGYVDSHLLVSARAMPGGTIMTLDGDLRDQAELLGVAYLSA